MPKMGTIAWHQQKIDEIRATHSKKAKAQHAKRKAKMKEGYNNNLPTHTKTPYPRYRSRIDYDFLKYIRVVFRWALVNNPELSRPQLEILLYLYGTGAFSKRQFNDFHKLLGMYSMKTLDEMIKLGFIKLWRPRKGRQHALYTLTQKAKRLCNKMHKYCAGVEEIPDHPSQNKMAEKDAPRMDGYYMNIIKKMNKDKAPK